jgi:AraC family transcriptional regulator, regulatory protein of adaptative response / methylated-DNA-[protein]-cysteine methyltransferase
VNEIPHTTRGNLDEELAWDAVLARDQRFGHAFVYAVQTTGVYCRVTCAARRPRRENVRFYRTPQEAAQAGFRACKRCRPDGTDPVGEVITRACLYLEKHVEDAVTLKRLGRAVRGRESRPHGEGRQQVRSYGAGMPGGRL